MILLRSEFVLSLSMLSSFVICVVKWVKRFLWWVVLRRCVWRSDGGDIGFWDAEFLSRVLFSFSALTSASMLFFGMLVRNLLISFFF